MSEIRDGVMRSTHRTEIKLLVGAEVIVRVVVGGIQLGIASGIAALGLRWLVILTNFRLGLSTLMKKKIEKLEM